MNPQSSRETQPKDFQPVFAVTDSSKQPALVVGGQAVNLWALYYLSQEPQLSQLGPFVSKDLDFLADHETVRQLSHILQQPPMRPPKGDPNPVLAGFKFTTPEGVQTTIEVLFTLYGVNPQVVQQRAVVIESLVGRIRLPDLVSCLQAKIHNALGLSQERRQDLKHIRILLFCNRAFLSGTLRAAENGRVSERNFVNALEALFKLVQNDKAQQVSLRFGIDWSAAFPIAELLASPLERAHRFMQHRFLSAYPQFRNNTEK